MEVGNQVLGLVLNACGMVVALCSLLVVEEDCIAGCRSLFINGKVTVDTGSLKLLLYDLADFVIADTTEECAFFSEGIFEHVVGSTH